MFIRFVVSKNEPGAKLAKALQFRWKVDIKNLRDYKIVFEQMVTDVSLPAFSFIAKNLRTCLWPGSF